MVTRRWFIGAGGMMALALGTCFVVPAPLPARPAGGKLKFEIYQDASKGYRWRLKAGNGAILGTSGQGYKAKADCKNGIERIKKDAAGKLKFESYTDRKGEYRWRIKASNGQTIGSSSEGYKAKADCEKAIDLIKAGAATATVEDMT